MISPDDNVIKKILPNGLTVLLKEDRSNPVVAINVWFGVGSAHETEVENGLAHFQEHMVFKGTERHGVGEIANLVKSAGGNLNAGTSYSYTMYYVVLPSKEFSLGLDIQADAMMNSTFDPEEFKKERLVVIDEAKMYDDTPDSYLFYRTMELGFEAHNYRRPIAGYEKIVREFTRDQLVGFYDRYYRPANAVLCVVGDVDPDEAMSEIEKVYGGWRNGAVDINQSPPEPEQQGFRFKAMTGSIDHAYFSYGFHVPSCLDADYPALEMLATLLGSGKSSRLYRNVREKNLATTASVDLLAEKWPGFLMLFASTPVDKLAAGRDAITAELARFQNEPVSEEELLKARRQVEKSTYSGLETVEGQASNMGYYEVLGDYRMAERHREAIRRVTPDEVMYVARKYLKVDNCSMVAYVPEGSEVPTRDAVEKVLAAKLHPEAPDPVVRAEEVENIATVRAVASASRGAAPKMTRSQLDNGVTLLVKRRAAVPMVSMLTLMGGGTRMDPPGKSGLSTLATGLLLKGTKKYDNDAIVNTIEGLGGGIDTFSSFDVTGAYINILSEFHDDSLDVYKDVMRAPTFTDDAVESDKSKLLAELAKRNDHPVYFSIDRLFESVFGDHPYAHPFIGDESELAKLTAANCRAWYDSLLSPENMTMVFVGDIEEAKARDIAERLYGDLPAAALPTPATPPPARVASAGMHELTRNNLRQAVAMVGYTAPPMMTKDAIALGVLNGIMTGLGGRLFVELRDKRSLGYMSGSAFSPLKERSIFYGFSNPGPEGIDEAIEIILRELNKVTQEPVEDEELKRSKEWLAGSQIMRLQRNLSQALEHGVYETLGFGYEVVDNAQELIKAVSKEDIMHAAAAVFTDDNMSIIKLIPKLEEEAAN